MAISEQKKVALCDLATRLPLNLFSLFFPPSFFSSVSVCREWKCKLLYIDTADDSLFGASSQLFSF